MVTRCQLAHTFDARLTHQIPLAPPTCPCLVIHPPSQGLAALTSCHMPSCLLSLPAEGGAVRVYDVARGSGGASGGTTGGVDVLCELEAHKTAVVSLACALADFECNGRGCVPSPWERCLCMMPTHRCTTPAAPHAAARSHLSQQTVMAWDDEGQLLATASKKGTVIRVHSVSALGRAWSLSCSFSSWRAGCMPTNQLGKALSS